MHRLPEINVINRRRHHMAVRVPVRRQRASYIDQVHQPSAQQVTQRVGIVWQDNFRHLRLRFMHRSRLQDVYRFVGAIV